MSDVSEISPAELVRDMLVRLGEPDFVPGGIVVGPLTDEQQQAGALGITQAGLPTVEKYTPIIWMRCQVRCMAPTLEQADRLGFWTQRQLHRMPNRVAARMASTDKRYLVHLSAVTAGPSEHYDSPETWEALVFAELMIGSEPLD